MTADFNAIAASIGELVTAKNEAYGDSFAKCGQFLCLLYPHGIQPAQYDDALAMVRIFDKQMRIATRKDAFGESPYRDIAGYGILGAAKDERFTRCHTPLSTEEVERISKEVAPSLCDSCLRHPLVTPHGEKCEQLESRPKDCEGYISAKEILPLGLCDSCVRAACPFDALKRASATGNCDRYSSNLREQIAEAKEPQALDLSLPTITQEGDLEAVKLKHIEEFREWDSAPYDSMAKLIEGWDCQQTIQTYEERGGDPDILPYVMRIWLADKMEEGQPVMQAKRIMLIKNAARGKYSPEDCARILASV